MYRWRDFFEDLLVGVNSVTFCKHEEMAAYKALQDEVHEGLEGLGELRLDVLVLIEDLKVFVGLPQVSQPVGVVDRVYVCDDMGYTHAQRGRKGTFLRGAGTSSPLSGSNWFLIISWRVPDTQTLRIVIITLNINSSTYHFGN